MQISKTFCNFHIEGVKTFILQASGRKKPTGVTRCYTSFLLNRAWSRYAASQSQRAAAAHKLTPYTVWNNSAGGKKALHTCMTTNTEMPCVSSRRGWGSIPARPHLPSTSIKRKSCQQLMWSPASRTLESGFQSHYRERSETYGRGTKTGGILTEEKMSPCISTEFPPRTKKRESRKNDVLEYWRQFYSREICWKRVYEKWSLLK